MRENGLTGDKIVCEALLRALKVCERLALQVRARAEGE
jgi:hypothetical protein